MAHAMAVRGSARIRISDGKKTARGTQLQQGETDQPWAVGTRFTPG